MDFGPVTLKNLRREAMVAALVKADASVKSTGEAIKSLKLTDASHAHLVKMERAYLFAAAELRKELSL